MTMLKPLGDAISANVNEAIESKAKPDKMARYYADRARQELDVSRNRAISIMADVDALRREIKKNSEEIAQMETYADAAMKKGNKDDARRFLEVKKEISDKKAINEAALARAEASQSETLAAYNAHSKEVAAMESDVLEIRANVATADAITAATQYPSHMSSRATTMFRKMREKARRRVDEANAARRLAQQETPAYIETLKEKYDAPVDVVAQELAALEQKYC